MKDTGIDQSSIHLFCAGIGQSSIHRFPLFHEKVKSKMALLACYGRIRQGEAGAKKEVRRALWGGV